VVHLGHGARARDAHGGGERVMRSTQMKQARKHSSSSTRSPVREETESKLEQSKEEGEGSRTRNALLI
jgi:hypothetical protein